MASSNENNRPEAGVNIGTISATGTYLLIHATKKILVHGVRAVNSGTAISASSTNYFTFQLKTLSSGGTETNTGDTVDNQAGLGKGAGLALSTPDDGITVEAGNSLVVTLTETGAATFSNCWLSTDYEVVGN